MLIEQRDHRFMPRFLVLWFCVACIAILPARAAHADNSYTVAAVQCDTAHNRMLIRFGWVPGWAIDSSGIIDPDEFAPSEVPKGFGDSWKGVPLHNGGNCKFTNGQDMSVATENAPPEGGELGADTATYFTLNIGGHFAYYGLEFYRGHMEGFDLSAIRYDGKSMLECNPQEPDISPTQGSNPICYDASSRLLSGYKYLTGPERDQLSQYELKQTLTKNFSSFCRTLQTALRISNTASNPNYVNLDSQISIGQEYLATGKIDIYNDGKSEDVAEVGENQDQYDNWSDWNYLIVFPSGNSNINKFITDVKNGFDPTQTNNPVATTFARWGAHFFDVNHFGSGIENYVSNDPVEYNHQIYILSQSDGDPDAIPSGIISQIQPDNTIKEICQFP